jgi:hypothetical protein
MHTHHLIIVYSLLVYAFCVCFMITIGSRMLYLFLLLLLYTYICVYLLLACLVSERRSCRAFSSSWGSPPYMFLVSDAGTVKDSKSCHNLLICKQKCVLLLFLLLFLLIIFILLLYYILYYSYSIYLYFKLIYK